MSNRHGGASDAEIFQEVWSDARANQPRRYVRWLLPAAIGIVILLLVRSRQNVTHYAPPSRMISVRGFLAPGAECRWLSDTELLALRYPPIVSGRVDLLHFEYIKLNLAKQTVTPLTNFDAALATLPGRKTTPAPDFDMEKPVGVTQVSPDGKWALIDCPVYAGTGRYKIGADGDYEVDADGERIENPLANRYVCAVTLDGKQVRKFVAGLSGSLLVWFSDGMHWAEVTDKQVTLHTLDRPQEEKTIAIASGANSGIISRMPGGRFSLAADEIVAQRLCPGDHLWTIRRTYSRRGIGQPRFVYTAYDFDLRSDPVRVRAYHLAAPSNSIPPLSLNLSPDGKRVAWLQMHINYWGLIPFFGRRRGGGVWNEVWLDGLDGSAPQLINQIGQDESDARKRFIAPNSLFWSRDGARLCFYWNDGLYSIPARLSVTTVRSPGLFTGLRLTGPLLWLLVFIGLVVAHILYFGGYLLQARTMLKRGDVAGARGLTERIIATPALFGSVKNGARVHLGEVLLQEGRYAEGIAHLHSVLDRHPAPHIELEARRDLAECLDALGRYAEADAERQAAVECVQRARPSMDLYRELGNILMRARRHTEARDAYDQARVHAIAIKPLQAPLALQAALEEYDCGRLEEAAHRAENILASTTSPAEIYSAYQILALTTTALGDIDRAERYATQMLALAGEHQNSVWKSGALTRLGMVALKRGHPEQSLDFARKAQEADAAREWAFHLLQAECYHAQGRWADALAALNRYPAARPDWPPSVEKYLQAYVRLTMAYIAAEDGDSDQALAHLAEARTVVYRDVRHSLWADAFEAVILALGQRLPESVEIAARVTERLPKWAYDRQTQHACHYSLVRVAYLIGDDDGCIAWSDQALAAAPPPASLPDIYYHRALSLLRQGKREAGRAALQSAVDLGLETHYSRLAAQELQCEA